MRSAANAAQRDEAADRHAAWRLSRLAFVARKTEELSAGDAAFAMNPTCHGPRGVEIDAALNTERLPPVRNFIAIPQSAFGTHVTNRQRHSAGCDIAYKNPEVLGVHLSSIHTSAQRSVELSSAAKNSSVFAGLAFQPSPISRRDTPYRRSTSTATAFIACTARSARCGGVPLQIACASGATCANCIAQSPRRQSKKAICTCAIGTHGLPRPPFVAWHDSCSSPLQLAATHRPPAHRECDVEED